MSERIIFLGIDGVLNDKHTRDYIPDTRIIGLDKQKLFLLRDIVSVTSAKIVLVSTWKEGWYKEKEAKALQDSGADYLDIQFARLGMAIYDKTERTSFERGKGIKEYLETHPASSWCIIDDEMFDDYDELIKEHLVKTDWHSGLTKEAAQKAKSILLQQT